MSPPSPVQKQLQTALFGLQTALLLVEDDNFLGALAELDRVGLTLDELGQAQACARIKLSMARLWCLFDGGSQRALAAIEAAEDYATISDDTELLNRSLALAGNLLLLLEQPEAALERAEALVRTTDGETTELLLQALVLRSRAHRMMGRPEAARGDLQSALLVVQGLEENLDPSELALVRSELQDLMAT